MRPRSMWARALAGALAAAASEGSAAGQTIALDDALARAERNAPLLRASRAAVIAAEARARQAGVSPNPELEVELEDALGTGPYSGFGGAELTVALGQRFERAGKRSARQALARAEVELANANMARARADIARDVRLGLADLTSAEERLALAREAVRGAEELARTARLLVETGRDPPLRQLRAEASLAEARAAEQQAMAQLEHARRSVTVLIGPGEEPMDVRAPVTGTTIPAQGSGQPLAIRLATAERRIAEARIDVERTVPRSDITARAGVRGYVETGDVALVAGVSLPLALRDRNRGSIEAAEAELTAAEARLAQARLDAEREVQDARSALVGAEARLAALEGTGLQQAREAVRVARIGYSAGKFSLLEVLDARTALNTALASAVDARRDRARALAALARAQAQ